MAQKIFTKEHGSRDNIEKILLELILSSTLILSEIIKRKKSKKRAI